MNNQDNKTIRFENKAYYEKNIKDNTGSLMCPSTYRELVIKTLDPKSYKKFRKDYNIKGRARLFINTEFKDEKPKINKVIKYKDPHFVNKDWIGAEEYQMAGKIMYVSYYTYGQMLVIN